MPPSSPPPPPSSPPWYVQVWQLTGIIAAVYYTIRSLLDVLSWGPSSPPPPVSSPLPPSPPSPPCIDNLAEGRTIRNGPIGNQWCYNLGVSPSVVESPSNREKCEGAYLDPATALSAPPNSYPYDCSGGCKLCQYVKQGLFYKCTASDTIYYNCD
mmetsp:Transcript_9959/g.30545  ORF Transcript_9959/g.30545 Transcript_9959/m.30545 type:complete len:155 (-) Transcript_9959:243-707(-)